MLNKLRNNVSSLFREQPDPYAAYDASRYIADKRYLCFAPFNNMYFNVHGEVAPCWLTLTGADNIREKSIKEIWQGNRFRHIRQAIEKRDLSFACTTCEKNIRSGNHISSLSRLYDLDYPLSDFPVEMEFELSNTCNLECVMCKGELSSTIRKNREQLPPLEVPYDENFVEQLTEFLPHLKEAKFLGGEPFLIPIYYKIWEKIIAVNPRIKITVTTNGTVWNRRVERILQSLDFSIIMSIDAFTRDTYHAIRIGSDFDKVISNFERFRNYTRQKKTYMGISVNPLRKNWKELKAYVDFCNQKDVFLWFNTIVYPFDEALWTWGARRLEEVYRVLSAQHPADREAVCRKEVYHSNVTNYKNLVEVQIKNWWQQAVQKEQQKTQYLKTLSPAELREKLREQLLSYVYSDAYLPASIKEQKALCVEEKINQLQSESHTGELKKLFLLPETEAMQIIANETL
ncbi:MAG: hypothetical protein KatS3mg031_0854 [Chitinophagales bacterium]|nr:MAG: hypothetical protein KatS3mg031_0854 [Chitinophagales bacterium]